MATILPHLGWGYRAAFVPASVASNGIRDHGKTQYRLPNRDRPGRPRLRMRRPPIRPPIEGTSGRTQPAMSLLQIRAWAERSQSRFVLTERGLPGFRAPTLRPDRPVSHGPDCFFEYGMV